MSLTLLSHTQTTTNRTAVGVLPFGDASTVEKDLVYGILADHKVYEVHPRLVYVCTGCGSIGEIAPLGDTGKTSATEVRNDTVKYYDLSCCGLVFTFAGCGE